MIINKELLAMAAKSAANTDLRALVKGAIAEALDLSPHSDTIDACSHRDPFEAYHMGFKDCREAVEAALDAQDAIEGSLHIASKSCWCKPELAADGVWLHKTKEGRN